MKIIHFFFLFLLGCGSAGKSEAEGARELKATNVGISAIGLLHEKWPCEAFLSAFRGAEMHVGYLEGNTFGNKRECLKRVMAHPNLRSLRIHLVNGPGMRNRRLQREEFFYGETKESFRQKLERGDGAVLREFTRIAHDTRRSVVDALHGSTQCYLSPVLEHNLSGAALRRLQTITNEVFGSRCHFVNNAQGEGVRNVGGIEEGHGGNPSLVPPNCIADPDGEEVSDFLSYSRRYRGCRAVYLWTGRMNLLGAGEAWKAPRARSSLPGSAEFSRMSQAILGGAALPREPASPPSQGCTRQDTFQDGAKNGHLWKPEADHEKNQHVVMFKHEFTRRLVRVDIYQGGKRVRSQAWDKSKTKEPWITRQGYYDDHGKNPRGRPYVRPDRLPKGPAEVRAIMRNGNVVCFNVPDTHGRWD